MNAGTVSVPEIFFDFRDAALQNLRRHDKLSADQTIRRRGKMKKNHFAARGKSWIAALSLAAMTTASTVPAAEKDPLRPDVQQQIRKTLQTRVELLDRLTVYSEKQYKQGSLDGNAVLQAQTDLYVAKLLMMKAEAGLPLCQPLPACNGHLSAEDARTDRQGRRPLRCLPPDGSAIRKEIL